MNKDHNLRKKIFKVIIAQRNHSQFSRIIANHHPYSTVFVEDHQINKSYKTDIGDQIFKTTSIEKFTLDQNLRESFTQTLIVTAHFKTIGIDTIPLAVNENLQIVKNESIQTIKIRITQILYHKPILTKDQIIIIIWINLVIILELVTTSIKIDQKYIFSITASKFTQTKSKLQKKYIKTSKTNQSSTIYKLNKLRPSRNRKD